MFDDIRGDMRNKTWVSVIIVLCASIITVLCYSIPELSALYGANHGPKINIFVRGTIPFQQGYSEMSSLVHLFVNIFLFWLFGSYLEKIVGSFRFLIITIVLYVFYVLTHRLFFMIGDGLTPLIMGYAGACIVVLMEGRYVKTRSVYDSYYKFLIAGEIVLWCVVPILMSFIPLYYDSQSPMMERLFLGNVLHFVCGISGVGLGILFRSHIRSKFLQRMHKRYIRHDRIDHLAVFAAFGFPIYLILVFLLRPM